MQYGPINEEDALYENVWDNAASPVASPQAPQQPRRPAQQQRQVAPVAPVPEVHTVPRHPFAKVHTYIFAFIACGVLYNCAVERREMYAPLRCRVRSLFNSDSALFNLIPSDQCFEMPPCCDIQQVTEFVVEFFVFVLFPYISLLSLILSSLTTLFPVTILHIPSKIINNFRPHKLMKLMFFTMWYQLLIELGRSLTLLLHCSHGQFDPINYLYVTGKFLIFFYLWANFAVCMKLTHYNLSRSIETANQIRR